MKSSWQLLTRTSLPNFLLMIRPQLTISLCVSCLSLLNEYENEFWLALGTINTVIILSASRFQLSTASNTCSYVDPFESTIETLTVSDVALNRCIVNVEPIARLSQRIHYFMIWNEHLLHLVLYLFSWFSSKFKIWTKIN